MQNQRRGNNSERPPREWKEVDVFEHRGVFGKVAASKSFNGSLMISWDVFKRVKDSDRVIRFFRPEDLTAVRETLNDIETCIDVTRVEETGKRNGQ